MAGIKVEETNKRIPLIAPGPKYGRFIFILLNCALVAIVIWQFMGRTFETFIITSVLAYLVIVITLVGLAITLIISLRRGARKNAMLSIGNAVMLLIMGELISIEVFRGDAPYSFNSLKYYGVSSDSFEVQVESVRVKGVIQILESDYDSYYLPLLMYMEPAGDPGMNSPIVGINQNGKPASLVVNDQEIVAPESSVVFYSSESEKCEIIEGVQWTVEIISDRKMLESFVTMIYQKYHDPVQPTPSLLER